ncbi:Zinc finger CCCH domain-containing protein 44 [Dichanthelium oligosanthes]|uniref:Zinc finger CCCH domain-containing protein 44 n=1 Tax=Dichanthelium oligosanthes TaxID=888268 RepID=A0A1E5VNY4_9POAL|nr:Zinc finger CCCH domain-containing protein 44 [Dichanthelium oligosanthes]
MDGGTGPGAEVLSPGEAEWPPELRLPPPPPVTGPQLPPAQASLRRWATAPTVSPAPHLQIRLPPAVVAPKEEQRSPPRHAGGFDDQQFLGSIMGAAAPQHHQQPPQPPQPQQPQQQQPAAEAPVKRKRGRPPKNRDGAPAAMPAPVKPVNKKDEEVVCFICFDGGDLVVCDRRGCPKVYHPACIKRDASFFRSRGKWDCGWHICSSCEKAVQYMCYTCTYSVCKGCIKQGKFFGVRGNKGFCDTCFGTILLIESKDDGAKVGVDFDDKNSWEYLFKLYWLDVKGKHLLTLDELISAKSCWTVPTTAGSRREKEESSDELYDANDHQDASFDISSRKRRRNNSSGNRGRKRKKDSDITATKCEISINSSESFPNGSTSEGASLLGVTKWASSELLEFIQHMRNGDSSYISQYDVQILLLEYINQNNLRDPHKKSQIICDTRLSNLFKKPRVARFEMLKLLEKHYLVKQTPTLNADSQRAIDSDSAEVDTGGYNELTAKLGSDKRRKAHKKIQREPTTNLEDYAAIDMHNINLIYLRRSVLEDLINDDAAFSDKIAGAFVRIRISGLGNKQDMYRLVKVVGTHKVAERYSVGKKTTDYALEISNLDKKEVITMDTISNHDFTEEECKRLRQSMKFGLTTRLKVGDIYEKAKIFHSLRFKDWLESEKQRLSHLRDRASETGRRKEYPFLVAIECVEKLQLLDTPEEKARRINEVPEVHVDSRMAPNYESAEEQNYKKAVDWTINRNGSDLGRKGAESNSVENHTQKCLDASGHTSSAPTEDVGHRSGAGSNINLNNTAVEPASLGIVSNDTEPEKVWHYKDPKGIVQGPFTLSQLSKWVCFFPRDLRIWLTFESEENALLLSEVLSKQQNDFVQPSSVTTIDKSVWAGTGHDRINSCSVANNSSSAIGYNVVYSSALSSQFADASDPTKEDPKPLHATLPLRSLKDAHTLHGQVQHQVNYSSTILSSACSYAPPGSHDERVPGEQVGKWNSCQDNGGMWSPTIAPMNHSCKSNVEQHPDGCTTKDQLQTDSISNLHKVSALTPQQSEKDPATSLSTTSLPEFKAMCQQESSYWNSAINAGAHDPQLSIALAKPESCSPTNPFEDRDSSSASAVSSHSGVPISLPQPAPSTSTSNSSKTEATMNQHKACRPDASNALFDQHPEPKSGPVFSLKTQDVECEYRSPTPKLERKETSMNQSGSTSVAPEDLATKPCVHSSVSFVSEPSGPPASKIDSSQSQKERSCLEEKHLRDRDSITQMEHLFEETTVKRNNKLLNPVSDAERIAVSDVLESLTEQNCEKYSIHEAAHLENFVPASAEEEQPQCSSPIALSPWGEPSYYQGEAVDSALWGVQDDPGNDMWSMPSPTLALQPSSESPTGVGADGKDTTCITGEVIAVRGNSASAETLPTQGEKMMEQGISSASTGPGVPEQVKPKPGAASGSSLEGSTKASGWQPSGSSLGGSAKASGWKPPALSLEGLTNDSGSQPSCPSTQGSAKASGWQRSSSSPDRSKKGPGWQPPGSSTEGSAKAAGWHRSSTSPERSRKASGWPRSGSFNQGSTKASGWQPSGSSTEGSAKVDGRQRTSSSPEGTRKSSGLHRSGRESSKVNSTSGAGENRKLSGHQATTPTGRHSSEAPKRQGNRDKSTAGWEEALENTWEASKRQGNSDKNAGWGEALGSNRSWHSSSGNASRGSQGHHHHDRHSHGSETWRGSSNHPRRSEHRHDHGSGGSSRPSPRGAPQRGVCKFYENGHCWKGSKCQYLHR